MGTSLGSALLGGTAAGVVAAVVNGLIYATGVIDQSVETPAGGPIPLAAVIIFSIVPNVIGGVVYWVLQRRVAAPLRTWRIVVAVVTVASFVSILGIEGAPATMLVALSAMHIIAGVAAYTVTPTVAQRSTA